MSTCIILHSLVDCRLISAISMERSSCWDQLTTHQNWFTSWKTPSKHHHFNAWFKGKSAKQKVFPVRGVATERKRVVEPRSLTSFNAADEESFSQLVFLRRILVLTLIEDPINVSPVKPPWRVSGTSRDFPAVSIWHGQASHPLTTWGVEPDLCSKCPKYSIKHQVWTWNAECTNKHSWSKAWYHYRVSSVGWHQLAFLGSTSPKSTWNRIWVQRSTFPTQLFT